MKPFCRRGASAEKLTAQQATLACLQRERAVQEVAEWRASEMRSPRERKPPTAGASFSTMQLRRIALLTLSQELRKLACSKSELKATRYERIERALQGATSVGATNGQWGPADRCQRRALVTGCTEGVQTHRIRTTTD